MRPSRRGLLLEDADELVADDAALLLGIGHAGEAGQEALARVDHDEVHAQAGLERLAQELRLALAHEPVVDVDAGQPVADGTMDERGRDRGVDAARQRADDLAVRAGRARRGRRRARGCRSTVELDEVRGRPGRLRAADAEHEVGEDVAAARRVHDLGVELDAVEVARRVGEAGVRRGVGLRGGVEAGGQPRDGVGVAHPDGLLACPRPASTPSGGAIVRTAGPYSRFGVRMTSPPSSHRHELGAVADAQDRQAPAPDRRVGLRSAARRRPSWGRPRG